MRVGRVQACTCIAGIKGQHTEKYGNKAWDTTPRGARSCTDVILHVSSLFEGATCTGMLLLQQLHCC